jgi:hypothetical protein
MNEQIKFLRKIKNLDLVRRVKNPDGELTAFDKFSSWWPNRGKLEKLPDALDFGLATKEENPRSRLTDNLFTLPK